MGVCAFAPFGWRLHGGGAFFLLAGGLPTAVPWVGWRGLRDARFKPEAAAGEAFFLRAGGRAGRCQEAGGGLPGSALPGAVLRAGGRNGVFVRLEGRRQARGRSSRLDGKGVEMIFGTQAGWCGGKPRSGRCLTGLSFLLEAAAGGGLVRLEGLKPAALTSGPEGRRWIWPSRGRHCAIRHLLAGGTNEDAHAPTTTPSPAGRSASSSEAPAFSARPVCV